MKLPPKQFRRCGSVYHNDDKYIELSLKEADRVLKYNPTNILDIGCGCGRLALALEERKYSGAYKGIDADRKAIKWADKNSPGLFKHFDGYNARFNRAGKIHPHEFELEKDTFDFVYMYAVFPHMLIDDVVSWTTQVYEALKPGGYFFTTVHAEEIERLIQINPENYPEGYKKETTTLHHVVYDKLFIQSLFNRAGFWLRGITKEWNNQTGYLMKKQ